MQTLNRLLRRSLQRTPPHLRLLHHATSSSSSPSFSTSLLHHRIHRQHDYNNNNSYCHSTASQISFPRHFSSQPEISSLDVPAFPQSALISLLDSYHDATGLPWWLIISSSTVAMRLVLVPVVILQMKKLRRIGEVMSKLPPPFPPPGSRISFRDQMSLFWKEKNAAGCPSLFWFIAALAVQAPCFILWIMSIRTMSLGHHSGFDCGGALWFQNLTDYSNGVWGPIFPLVIAGLHFTNVQLAFGSSLKQLSDPFGKLAKWYHKYLQVLTLPIMFTTFNLPQGSLVYWITNSSMSLIQATCLRNPHILTYLGMPKLDIPMIRESSNGGREIPDTFIQTMGGPVAARSLSPVELCKYSTKLLADGRDDTAINMLRIALEKDPGHVSSLILIGEVLLEREQFQEAIECYESAIAELLRAGINRSEEQLDLLIFSSQLAGIACAKLGKNDESLVHLERVAELDEPENPRIKDRYYGALYLLVGALLTVDRKDEALKYLQKLVAHDPAFTASLKQLEDEMRDFADGLASSRRDF